MTSPTDITELLKSKGWVKSSVGQYRSNGQTKEYQGFNLFIRKRNLNDYIDDFSKKSSSSNDPTPYKNGRLEAGSSQTMGNPNSELTPSCADDDRHLPILSSFANYPSLKAARKDEPCLLIGFDSEWETLKYGRDMLSWQFALVHGTELVEFVFLKDGWANLSFIDALGCILDHLEEPNAVEVRDIRSYMYCAEWKNNKPIKTVTKDIKEAKEKSRYVYRSNIGFTEELIEEMSNDDHNWERFYTYNDFSQVKIIKICIVCHAGMVDLSSLYYGEKNLLRYLTEVQGGLVSLQPVRYTPRSLKKVDNARVYRVSLSIADTMCHAPAGKKKLKDLGEVLGIEKIDIDTSQKEHMKDLLAKDPSLFMEYASKDSVVTVLYSSAMYGYNNALPVTVTSATAIVMKETMMEYLDCDSTDKFNRVYRGLKKVKKGKFKIPDRPGFVEATNLEPISNDANTVQYYASQAYHGGYNICTEVGYFPFETFDYDLQNAYPTAMCLVPDIDWENPIRSEVIRRDLTLGDFTGIGVINPITPFVGYVSFKFPDSVKYPCIPINVDGVPVYPRSSDGMDGVYVAGPFVWLALKLGAHVNCDRGYFLNVRYSGESEESRSLATAVKQLVVDRNRAKHEKGKGSLEELILKTMVNSGYGKNAQNVVQKNSWSAYKDIMEDLGCSAITNPVSAMMITSIVQVELIAAQNQIHELGYMSCSVTTDGFISNIPEDILKSLDLYGLRKFIETARVFLTDVDPELWEVKHIQDDLVNFTTRGNVSLHDKTDGEYVAVNPMIWDGKEYAGVCAHNSAKSGFESDSYNDRLWLMIKVLGRTSTVDYTVDEWTPFKELVQGKPFVVNPVTRHIHMDFDMKRKPIRESFKSDRIFIYGKYYEIAHFDTEPFKNIEEFRLYRNKKKLTDVLRTEADWEVFWVKLDLNSTGAQPRDMEWSILNSCIMGYRAGRWDIPGLKDKTVEEKCDWINKHSSSGRKFKPSDWKNARRPERQANMLPYKLIEKKLNELIDYRE